MVSCGIFGPKLSGKTTLAMELSRAYWVRLRVRTLALDPHIERWGPQALVTADEKVFWENVWKTTRCLIIVEEAAATIRRERDLIPVFTRLRHCNHILIVIGHSGMDLLPVMRQQLDTLYLFRQPESAAKVWAEVFTQKELLQAVDLKQFEFLKTKLYGKPCKCILSR